MIGKKEDRPIQNHATEGTAPAFAWTYQGNHGKNLHQSSITYKLHYKIVQKLWIIHNIWN